jgi:hypothetical protein
MRIGPKFGLISCLSVLGCLLSLNDSRGADVSSSQDEYLSCFQKTIGVVNAEREDHAPTLFSGKDLIVLLPAIRDRKKGFYLYTQHSAFFQVVIRAGSYYVLNRPGHPALKFSVEKGSASKRAKADYQVTQYPTEKAGATYSQISPKNVFDSSARGMMSRELQKRMESFASDLNDLERDTKRLKSARSFAKVRLDNIDTALQECELIKKDAPLHSKTVVARKKLNELRDDNDSSKPAAK